MSDKLGQTTVNVTDTPVIDALLQDWVRIDVAEGSVFFGTVMFDRKERFTDGQYIRTSLVKKVEKGVVQTMNTLYLLGREAGTKIPSYD